MLYNCHTRTNRHMICNFAVSLTKILRLSIQDNHSGLLPVYVADIPIERSGIQRNEVHFGCWYNGLQKHFQGGNNPECFWNIGLDFVFVFNASLASLKYLTTCIYPFSWYFTSYSKMLDAQDSGQHLGGSKQGGARRKTHDHPRVGAWPSHKRQKNKESLSWTQAHCERI